MALSKSFNCAFPGCDRNKGHAVQACSEHQPILMGKDGHKAERYALSIAEGRDKMGVDAYGQAAEADLSVFPERLQTAFSDVYDEYFEIDGSMVRKTCECCDARATAKRMTDDYEIQYVCEEHSD